MRCLAVLGTVLIGLLLGGCSAGSSAEPDTPTVEITTTMPTTQPAVAATTTLALTTTEPPTTTSPGVSVEVGWEAPALGDGCDPARPHDAGLSRYSLMSGGVERSYVVHVPTIYDGSVQWPVIVALHGRTVSAQEWFDLVWRGIAEGLGYLLVLPDAVERDWAEGSHAPDVPFVAAVVDDVAEKLCVDESRIYASGGSDGADMVTRLACDLSDRLAAVRPFAGGTDPEVFATEDCRPSRAVPVTSYVGTREPIYDIDAVSDGFGAWAERNGCDALPVIEAISPGRDVTRYQGCEENAAVELFVLHGIDHTAALADCTGTVWGFCTEFPIDMTAVMVEFFEAHPLPRDD